MPLPPLRLSLGLVCSLLLLAAAALLEAGFGHAWLGLSPKGFGGEPLVFFDGLLALTVAFFIAALAVSHTRLALVQAIVTLGYGVVIVVAGVLWAMAAAAKLVGLLTLLFAFPFGTIAYFAKFGCLSGTLATNPAAASAAGDWLIGSCFDATQLVVLAALVLKVAGLAALLVAALKFAQIKGLVVLAGLSGVLSLGLIGFYGAVDGLGLVFMLYPADAVASIVVGLVAVGYGIWVFLASLYALAMAVAAQAA